MTVTRVFADRANRYTPSVVRIIVFSKVTSKMNSLPLWSITELLTPDGMVGIGITLTTDTAGSSTWAVAVFAARKRIKTARNHRIEPPDTSACQRVSVPDRKNYAVDALLLSTVLIWGFNYAIVKMTFRYFHPIAFNAVRFTVSSAGSSRSRGRVLPQSHGWAWGIRRYCRSLMAILFGRTR